MRLMPVGLVRRLLLPALAAFALAGAGPGPRAADAQENARPAHGARLFLTGRATLEAPPDFASVLIGVGAKAPSASAALDETSTAAARIVEAARKFGIAPADIQTSYVSLQPAFREVRNPNGRGEQIPDGYGASNNVAIRVRDLGRLGEFLRAVVDGGANRIGGVDFALADPGKLAREATAAAVKDARLQAESIAEAAGVRLGRVEEIRYGVAPGMPNSPAPAYRRTLAAAAPPVPVEAGSLEVSSEVQVVFTLETP